MTLNTTALHDLSVVELAAGLRGKQFSAVEAAQHFLARAKAHQNLGAYVALNEDATLAQARAQDAALAAGTAAPLAGVPIAHKDIFVTRDFPSTAGSKMLAGYQSPFDATVVTRLADAGWRMEPPVSVPVTAGARRADTATALPPEEPPGMRLVSQGLRTGAGAS